MPSWMKTRNDEDASTRFFNFTVTDSTLLRIFLVRIPLIYSSWLIFLELGNLQEESFRVAD